MTEDYSSPEEVAKEIDRQIHTDYRLWDTNYFAYDHIEGTARFAEKYEDMSTKKFLSRYKDLNQDLREIILRTYANPVYMQLKALGQ